MKTNTTLLITAAFIALAACSKKKPADLPPPPPTTNETAPPADTSGSSVGSTSVPGSRADFLEQVGSDTVHFGTDLYDLDGEATGILAKQAQWLQKYPNVRVTIEGHCDERGTREYNIALGDRRANSAKNYLVSNGVDASRISTISYGKERPVANGSDEGAWAQNRDM